MDALMFLEAFNRMCDTCWVENCRECPLKDNACSLRHGDNKKIIATVEKWSAEHPVKTRLMDFSEKYPKAIEEDGLPVIWYPISLGYCDYDSCGDCPHGDMSQDQRKQCWNLPLEGL